MSRFRLLLPLAVFLSLPAAAQDVSLSLTKVVIDGKIPTLPDHKEILIPVHDPARPIGPSAAAVIALVDEYADQVGGCVAMTPSAAREVMAEASCGGGSLLDHGSPLDDAFDPIPEGVPGAGVGQDDGSCEPIDGKGCDIPVPGTDPRQDCAADDGCGSFGYSPDSAFGVGGAFDEVLGEGEVLGLKLTLGGTTVPIQDPSKIFEDLVDAYIAGLDEGESGDGEDEELVDYDAAGLGLGQLIEWGKRAAQEDEDDSDGDGDPPTDGGNPPGDPPADPEAPADRPHPLGDGGVPVGCEEAAAAAAPRPIRGDIDPSPLDDPDAGSLYVACFEDADILHTLDLCYDDLKATPDPTDDRDSLCTYGEVMATLPILTRNDLVIDPSPADDDRGGPPPGVPGAPGR